jgi:hypothetical protein
VRLAAPVSEIPDRSIVSNPTASVSLDPLTLTRDDSLRCTRDHRGRRARRAAAECKQLEQDALAREKAREAAKKAKQ